MWILETIDRELAALAAARAVYGGSLDLINQLLDERLAFTQLAGGSDAGAHHPASEWNPWSL